MNDALDNAMEAEVTVVESLDGLNVAKEGLQKYYREPKKSAAPLPFHLIGEIIRSFKTDHFVSDTGDVVAWFYMLVIFTRTFLF